MAGLILGLLALAASGCSVAAQSRAQVVKPGSVPFGLLEPSPPAAPTTPTASVPPGERVALCFVSNGALTIVTEPLPSPVQLLAAIEALALPPVEGTQSLQTALSGPSLVSQVTLQGGVATVDLQQAISTLGGDSQLLAVAQIVCTLTGRPGVGQVAFTLNGAPAEVPRADGSLASTPVSRDDYASLMP